MPGTKIGRRSFRLIPNLEEFQRALLAWYRANRRDLPWRRTKDAYRILVSEVMLQQTRVDTVVGYYERFLARFPNVRRLAEAPLDDVLKQWEGLGYYARARNLHKAAKVLITKPGGRVPDSKDLIRTLPGVGEYIAAAVLSIAYGVPLAVVDGNVKRVIARLEQVATPVNDPAAMRVFSPRAFDLLDKTDPGSFNQAMMELGALICTPQAPKCDTCPVSPYCAAKRHDAVLGYPKTIQRRAVPTVEIAVGVVRRAGRLLITKRSEDGLLGGLYEFPGGKMEPGETAEAACRRELLEEVGLSVQVGEKIATVRHAYTHFKIVMHVFVCREPSGRVRLNGPTAFRWVRPSELRSYPFPKANLKFMHLLE